MIKRVKKTITKNEYYCDDCGKEISVYDLYNCTICNKLLCDECITHRIDTNYLDNYCKSCWNKGEKYREDIKKFEEQIEELNKEWERECKEGKG